MSGLKFGVALVAMAVIAGQFLVDAVRVDATSGVTMLSETFDSTPVAPWILGGGASTVGAGYPKVESRNSSNRLRLTRATANEGGYALYDSALPTTGGLDITFEFEMWGGGNNGADGIAFLIVDGDTSGIQLGVLGGGLGYIGLTGTGGAGSLLGIGLDRWGGFRTAAPTGGSAPSDCSTSFGFGLWADAITVRGPGSTGANVITSSDPCSAFFGDYKQSRNDPWTVRSNRERTARIVIDPSTVANPQVKVYLDDPYGDDVAGGNFAGTAGVTDASTPRLTFAQPAELRAATSFKFGFVAATGGSNNNHDILGLAVGTRQALPGVQWVTAAALTGGTVGSAYSVNLDASGGLPGYAYSLVSGSLPAGLSLSGGVISGTPTTCEDATFVLRVSDRQSPASTADRTFTMRVNDAQQSCTYVVPTTTTSSAVATTTVSNSSASANSDSTPGTLPQTGITVTWLAVSITSIAVGTGVRRIRRR